MQIIKAVLMETARTGGLDNILKSFQEIFSLHISGEPCLPWGAIEGLFTLRKFPVPLEMGAGL